MRTLATLLLLLALAEPSFSLSPADCEAAGPKAAEILNLINDRRREGYQFQLLRVADAHTDVHEEGSAVIHYLVLDVIESDCSVLSRKPVEDCQSRDDKRPTEIVIGKCKVVAVTHPNTSCEPELNKVISFNCTTSSVSSALTGPTSEPVIIDYFENPEQYKQQAEEVLKQYQKGDDSASSLQLVKVERALEARGGERTTLYLDFSIANHSAEARPPPPPHHVSGTGAPCPPPPHHFFRSCPVFGFCQADLVYKVENPDLNVPDEVALHCDFFHEEDSRNFHSGRHHHRHHGHFCGHGHHHPHPHHHHSSEDRGLPPTHPPSLEEKEPKGGPQEGSPVRDESVPHLQGTRPPFGHDGPHWHGPQGPCPFGPSSHKHGPRGRGPHGHGRHGHGPHGHGPHGHGPHRHGPHGHGPCRHGPPPGHLEEQDVHRLPPLKKGEVLPLPEISIPSRGHCPHSGHRRPPKPEIQPFPQTSSESCPGNLKYESPQLLPFLGK